LLFLQAAAAAETDVQIANCQLLTPVATVMVDMEAAALHMSTSKVLLITHPHLLPRWLRWQPAALFVIISRQIATHHMFTPTPTATAMDMEAAAASLTKTIKVLLIHTVTPVATPVACINQTPVACIHQTHSSHIHHTHTHPSHIHNCDHTCGLY
jgi:hypothetical protein